MNSFTLSDRGADLIKAAEGLRLTAYRCPAGVWTIGFGHTANVKEFDTCTIEQADALLFEDCFEAEEAVKQLVKVPINQNQFDALVSFTFNLGVTRLEKSTLLRKLNTGDYIGCALEFPRWNKAGGKILPGLVKRRLEEQTLFTEGPA